MHNPHHACIDLKIIRYDHVHLAIWETVTLRPYWRLYYNPSPGALVKLDERSYPLDKDKLILIPPNTPVEQHLVQPCDTLYLHFSLAQPYDLVKGKVFNISLNPSFRKLLKGILSAFSESDPHEKFSPSFGLQLHALITNALATIPDKHFYADGIDPRVEHILELLHATPLSDHHNDDLGEAVGLTMNATIRLFGEAMGMPPQTYLRQLRLQHAAELLTQTALSLENIAELTRFCDRHHFSRCFKAHFHEGPAHYRKQAKFA
jgi:AraC-like DNA-binding protein